jgi:hypothetical protein
MSMKRFQTLLALPFLVAGCGVAGTGASAGAAAETAAQQEAQGRAMEQRVREQVDAAYSKAAEQRRAAEADGQ